MYYFFIYTSNANDTDQTEQLHLLILVFLFAQEVRNFSCGFDAMFFFSTSSKLLCSKLRLYTTFNLYVKVYVFLNCNKRWICLTFTFHLKALQSHQYIKIRNRTRVNMYLVKDIVLLKCFPMDIQITAAQYEDLHSRA